MSDFDSSKHKLVNAPCNPVDNLDNQLLSSTKTSPETAANNDLCHIYMSSIKLSSECDNLMKRWPNEFPLITNTDYDYTSIINDLNKIKNTINNINTNYTTLRNKVTSSLFVAKSIGLSTVTK
jgi:hypothetical protein